LSFSSAPLMLIDTHSKNALALTLLGPNHRRTSIQILHPIHAPSSEFIEDGDNFV
jgi:hypothetical protein